MPTWVSIKDASKELNVHHMKLGRLAKKKVIDSKPDPTDGRVVLVDLDQLRTLFSVRTRLSDSTNGTHYIGKEGEGTNGTTGD